jgi:uncharacterized protein YnzC (UPF0291/DUF896 family)
LIALSAFIVYVLFITQNGGKNMLSPDKIKRINELSKKSKTTGLSIEEAKEQTQLRKEYLETFRSSMRDTIEHVKVLDPEGNDVTPDKVKNARTGKYLN